MTAVEIKKICYEKFGGYGLIAYKILIEAQNHKNIHNLCLKTGVGYKFVKDVMSTFAKLDGDCYSVDDLHIEQDNQQHVVFDAYKNDINEIVSQFTLHNKRLDHVSADVQTLLKRAKYIYDNNDVENCKILFLGDHDFSSIALAYILKKSNINYNISVADIDDNILNFICNISFEYGLNIKTLHSDFRIGVPTAFGGQFDLIFSDPPYTPEGMSLFLKRAIECAKDKFSSIYLCYKTAELSPAIGLKVQKEMIKYQVYFGAILPNFNQYVGAEALGYRSDLYICSLTPKCFDLLNENQSYNIYTHGGDSIEATQKIKVDYKFVVDIIKEKYNYNVDMFRIITNKQSQNNGNIINISTFYKTKRNKNFNIPKDSILLHDFSYQNADVLDLRVLIMSDKQTQFGIFSKQQTKVLFEKKFDAITSLYEISQAFQNGDFVVMRFDLKTEVSNSTKSIMIYKYSSIKNAYINLATKYKGITKNDARTEFASFGLQLYEDCFVFDLPLNVMKYLYKKVC